MFRLALLLLVVAGLLSARVNAQLSDHEQGRKIYNYRCYYCHGYSGDAKTLAARFMAPQPRNFTAAKAKDLNRAQMLDAVSKGRDGTAMTSFSKFLTPADMELVVDFIRDEFIDKQKENTKYHTLENGWPNHQKYQIAFEFATGETPLDVPAQTLNRQQRRGLSLYLTSCITCHDQSNVLEQGPIWQLRAISFPRNNFSFTNFDGFTGASVYQRHDTQTPLTKASPQQLQGQQLFQNNCAFCHARDGTGKNWIGSFLEQPPRNLTSKEFNASINTTALKAMIENGKVNTSMPAWKDVLTAEQITAIVAYIERAFSPQGIKP
jgi:cytochrome c oxidase cbb3-type subunit 3